MQWKKDLRTDLVSTVFMLCIVVPAMLLLVSIPQSMLNWPVVLLGGVFFFGGLFGKALMINTEDFFGKKEACK